LTNKNNTEELLAPFPYAKFPPLMKSSSLAITGLNATGKSLLMFDIGAQLIVAGKTIGIIADELTNDDVINMLSESMKKSLIFEGITDELEIHQRMQKRVIIFNGFDSFKRMVENTVVSVLGDIDAILCDTIPLGTTTISRSELVSEQLHFLDKVKSERGMLTLYNMTLRNLANSQLTGVLNLPIEFDRILVTSKHQGNLKVEEVNKNLNIIVPETDVLHPSDILSLS
jgi:hypothetical protein